MEAYFSGFGFEPHRHDTYAVGRTLAGVHSFRYRDGMKHSLPGGTIVIHPDELHDGEAGSIDGFHYRILYIEPALLQKALGGTTLPFVPDGISRDPRLYAATQTLMQEMDCVIEPLEEEDAIYDLAQALAAVSGIRKRRRTLNYTAAERAREFIHSALDSTISLDQLEAASGRDRWSLSRDFRALYGTSPYRYLTMRRLDQVRRQLLAGQPLIDAALSLGFADQSHMTRHFKKAYGISPARWLEMLRRC